MIEFLFWEGCPSHERALADLIEELDAQGIARDDLRVTEINTAADTERERFVGSPTIRADGVDLADPGDEPFGLNCRIYYHRDGRPSPLPDREDLRQLLAGYARKHQGE
ncbi:MAG: thioredoxin family protein [Solirubrobacterales bacterium]